MKRSDKRKLMDMICILMAIFFCIPLFTLFSNDAKHSLSDREAEVETVGSSPPTDPFIKEPGNRANTEVALIRINHTGGVPGWEIIQGGVTTQYSLGVVGETTQFTVAVKNNMRAAVDNVDVLCEIRTANTTEEFEVSEVFNTTKTIGRLAGGATVDVRFSYRFLFSFLYNISASINVSGDTDRSNDNISMRGWVNKWADDCENGEGLWTHEIVDGNTDTWHVTDSPPNPNGPHTSPNAWYHGRDGDPDRYPNGASMALTSPKLDLSNMRTAGDQYPADFSYPMSYAYKITGRTYDNSGGDILYTDEVSDDGFLSSDHIFSTGNQPPDGYAGNFQNWIPTSWYSDTNGNGQTDPGEPQGIGVPMGLTRWDWQSPVRDFSNIQFRFLFSADDQNSHIGFYIDDIIVFGLERYVEDVEAPAPVENVIAWDRLFDGGGHLWVKWSKSVIWDFDHYDLYASDSPIYNVSGMTPVIEDIDEASNTTHLIGDIHGAPLQDNKTYYFAVTSTDIWGNGDPEVVNGTGKCFDDPPKGVTGIRGRDVPDDEGSKVNLTWSSNDSPDFDSFNVYLRQERIVSLAGLEPYRSGLEDTGLIIKNLTNDEGYFFTVTSVDDSLNRNENVTITPGNTIGPIIPRDDLPPPMVRNVSAYDTPGDNGGSINVSWDRSLVPDLDHYDVYIDDERIRNVSSVAGPEKEDIEENRTVLTTILGNSLIDDREYYVAVVAVDTSDNYLEEVISAPSAKSFENIPPPPIESVFAQDAPISEAWPDIGGRAIKIDWLAFPGPDFDHYNIYIDNRSFDWVDDMGPEKSIFDTNTSSTILTTVDGRPLINLEEEYYIAMTAVDRRGNENKNVEVTGPIKCWENYPPGPVRIRDAYDTPDDSGGSVTLVFEKSDEEDVVRYEIYVGTSEFYTVKGRDPEVVIEGDEIGNKSKITTVIEIIDGDRLENGREYYFAVNAVDRSGNRITDVEPYGPVKSAENLAPNRVEGVRGYDRPDDGGGWIVVEWDQSQAADFDHYQVFVFSKNVTRILPYHNPYNPQPLQSDGSHLRMREDTELEIDKGQAGKLLNDKRYWVTVVAYDNNGNFLSDVECYGPVIPRKNIFPELEISVDIAGNTSVEAGGILELEVNVSDPLDDDYSIIWYLNGKRENRFRDQREYRKLVKEKFAGYDFEVRVELVGDDGELFDEYKWNVTVDDPSGKSSEEGGLFEKTTLVLGIVGAAILLILLVVMILAVVVKKRKNREEDLVVPRHISPTGEFEEVEEGRSGEAGPAREKGEREMIPGTEGGEDIEAVYRERAAEALSGVEGTSAALPPSVADTGSGGRLALPPHTGEAGGEEGHSVALPPSTADTGSGGRLALPPHTGEAGGEEGGAVGQIGLDEIFASLEGVKKVAKLPSGKSTVCKTIRKKVRTRKIKRTGGDVTEGDGEGSAEEEEEDEQKDEQKEEEEEGEEKGEGEGEEGEGEGEPGEAGESFEEQKEEGGADSEGEDGVIEKRERGDKKDGGAESAIDSADDVTDGQENFTGEVADVTAGEDSGEDGSGAVTVKETPGPSGEENASGPGAEAGGDTGDVPLRIEQIAQQAEEIQRKEEGIAKRLEEGPGAEEERELTRQYQELEQRLSDLKEEALTIQQGSPVEEEITVQCYNCKNLLRVDDPSRPIKIICPYCSTESILDS